MALHQMLDRFRADLDTHVDLIAERIVQLGHTALGTSESVLRGSRLASYPTHIHEERAHLSALIDRYADVADAARDAIDRTAEAGDAGTSDLLTAFSRALDEMVWFMEAHIYAESESAQQTRPRLPVSTTA